MHVAIVGAGAIGASIAHRLVARGAGVTLVERNGVAGAASGKAGGFLARDWCDGGPLQDMARRSFDLHAALAADGGEAWGYRRLHTFAGATGTGGRGLAWTAPGLGLRGRLGAPDSTAQVDPAAFTRAMVRGAQDRGATLRAGAATGLLRHHDRVVGVEVGAEAVAADAVVIAMGPWSILAAAWLSLPPVYGLKGHSAVFDTRNAIPPEALFLEDREAPGAVLTPEVFPRADGTTYVCAISSEPALPVDPALVAPDEGAIDRLLAACRRISPAFTRSRLLRAQACFRPVTRDGLPLIGGVPGAPGAYVATGHGVWGILNAPATGDAVAELVLDGAARSLDLRPFDPARMAPARRAPVRRELPRATA